jgi:ABC-2 type transport system ATP-binding protein
MIRTQALTKYYGNRCAVRDLTVEIADREIVGFLGLNGAGKTTALRMLAGQLSPSAGRIEIDGRDMIAAGEAMRWRIGFLPERPPIYEDMTVRAYLHFAARLRGYDPQKTERRVDEVLMTTSTRDYADELISSLSHGFKQRVGIAQAIIHDPALVILDEPNNGLDPAQIKEMRTLIRDLRARHTVLLSSHMLSEISQTCDRLMVIGGGKLLAVGTEAELGSSMGDARRYSIEVSGDADLIDRTLKDLQDKKLVNRFSKHPRAANWEIRVGLAEDKPEELARALMLAGIGLRRLEPTANELESLFLQLTQSPSARTN